MSKNSISHDDYLKKFNCKEKEALKHALDIRKFEIELYWKRATYFWAFIAVTFAGYLSVQKFENRTGEMLSIILSCLGLIFSLAWVLVNRGSKKWQENWENQVDLLEDKITGPLYKTVLSRKKPEGFKQNLSHLLTGPSSFSVSKINQLISEYIVVIWLFLLWYALPEFKSCSSQNIQFVKCVDWFYFLIVLVSLLFCISFFILGKTHDNNEFDIKAHLREVKINSD